MLNKKKKAEEVKVEADTTPKVKEEVKEEVEVEVEAEKPELDPNDPKVNVAELDYSGGTELPILKDKDVD